MGTDAEHLLHVFRHHELSDKLVPVVIEAVEDPGAYVVDPALLRPVKRGRVPVIVAFGADRMHFCVGRPMESFLEEYKGSDIRRLKLFILFDGGGRDIYVDPADGFAPAVFICVDAFHAFYYVVQRRIDRILSRFHRDPFVAESQYRIGFLVDLLHSQPFSEHG